MFGAEADNPFHSAAFVLIVCDSAATSDVFLPRLPLCPQADTTQPPLIHLSTKYYTAKVPVRLVFHNETPQLPNSFDGSCQALILLFTQDSEWPVLLSWMQLAQETQPEVLMVVRCVDSVDENDEIDERRMAPFKDQTIDAGFEWIEFAYQKDYGLDEEKEGIARVVEALEGCVWPSEDSKTRLEESESDDFDEKQDGDIHESVSSLKPSESSEPAISNKPNSERLTSADELEEIIETPSYSTETLSRIQSTETKQTDTIPSLTPLRTSARTEVIDTLVGPEPSRSKKKTKKKRGKTGTASKSGNEEDIDEFENLMATMLQMREMARNSTDADRRRIAEQFTMKLLQSMGDEEDD